MLVKDVMTTVVVTCAPASSAGDAAGTMRDGGCGCLPVRDRWDVPVSEIMSPHAGAVLHVLRRISQGEAPALVPASASRGVRRQWERRARRRPSARTASAVAG